MGRDVERITRKREKIAGFKLAGKKIKFSPHFPLLIFPPPI